MYKTLFYIVSLFIYVAVFIGYGKANALYSQTNVNTTTLTAGGTIPLYVLEENPYSIDIHLLWKTDYETRAGNTVQASYGVYGEHFYTLNAEGVLSARHLETLDIGWQKPFKFKPSVFNSFITAWQDILFLGKDTSVYGIERHTGKILWKQTLTGSISSPIKVSHAGVIFQTEEYKIYTLDRKTGAIKWTHTGDDDNISPSLSASPVIDANKVYVQYPTGQMVALDTDTGEVLWTKNLSGEKWFSDTTLTHLNSPIVHEDTLIQSSAKKNKVVLNKKTGSALSIDTAISSVPLTTVGNVIIRVENNIIYTSNILTKVSYWTQNLNTILGVKDIVQSTYYYKGRLIISTKRGKIVVLTIDTGAIIAVHKEIYIQGVPTTVAGKLIILDKNGNVRAYK